MVPRPLWLVLSALLTIVPTAKVSATTAAIHPMPNARGVVDLSSGERFVWSLKQVQLRNDQGRWSRPIAWPRSIVWGVWPHGKHSAAVILGDARPGRTADEIVGVEVARGGLTTTFRIALEGRFIEALSDPDGTWILNSRALYKLLPTGVLSKVTDRQGHEDYLLRGGILCEQTYVTESSSYDRPPARCRRPDSWEFDTLWSHVQPTVCGSWLLETRDDAVDTVNLRSTETGKLLRGHQLKHDGLQCLPHERVLDRKSNQVFALPSFELIATARCGRHNIRYLSPTTLSGAATACIDVRGKVGSVVLRMKQAKQP